jgi:hypothetical protein
MIGTERKLHVLRDVDHHRPWPAGGRDIKRLVEHPRQILDPAHQPVVLGTRTGNADRVAFLERVVADQMRRHLASDADQRNRVHQRIGQRRHHVGGARSRRYKHHARQSGRARIAFGSMARALFVTNEDVLHVALLEDLVIDRKDRATRIAEQVLDAVILERAHHHSGAGHLVRIVDCVFHGLLQVRLPAQVLVVLLVISGNKKGP